MGGGRLVGEEIITGGYGGAVFAGAPGVEIIEEFQGGRLVGEEIITGGYGGGMLGGQVFAGGMPAQNYGTAMYAGQQGVVMQQPAMTYAGAPGVSYGQAPMTYASAPMTYAGAPGSSIIMR